MKTVIIILALGILLVSSCKKDELGNNPLPLPAEEGFAATDVLVQTQPGFSTRKVFAFINSLQHEVEYLTPDKYTSLLPGERLADVLDYFNGEPYLNEHWPVHGYVQPKTQQIVIFPRLFAIKDTSNQQKWITAMQDLQLDDSQTSFIIHFHVPEGTEKEWLSIFRKHPFIAWAELNYTHTLRR